MNPRNQSAESYLESGIKYWEKGEFDKAIAHYNEAIKLNPQYVTVYYNRAIAYRAKGNLDKAIADYSKAIKLNPEDTNAYYNRGNAYLAKGEFDKAITDYSEAIKLNPRYANAYNNRGAAYCAKHEFDKARIDYDKIIELHKINPKSVNSQCLELAKDQLTHALNYDTKDLDEKEVTDEIEKSRKKYSAIPLDFSLEKAFLLRAFKKQNAPILVVGTHHCFVGEDPIDRFHDNGVIPFIISSVNTVFTEIALNTDAKYIINRTNINLSNDDNLTNGTIFAFDQMFATEAASQKKKLKPLENTKIRKICGAVKSNDLFQDIRNNTSYYNNEIKNYLTYIDRDYTPLPGSINREFFWIPKSVLPTSEAGQTSLYVFGNSHKLRFLNMLAAEGYTIEPLIKQAPTPKSEIVRALYYGNSPLKFFKQSAEQNKKRDEDTATKLKQPLRR